MNEMMKDVVPALREELFTLNELRDVWRRMKPGDSFWFEVYYRTNDGESNSVRVPAGTSQSKKTSAYIQFKRRKEDATAYALLYHGDDTPPQRIEIDDFARITRAFCAAYVPAAGEPDLIFKQIKSPKV